MTDKTRDPVYEDVAAIRAHIGNLDKTVEKGFEKLDSFCTQVTQHEEQIGNLQKNLSVLEETRKTWANRAWSLIVAIIASVVLSILSLLNGRRG